jgi:hypothetical protein
LLPIRSAAVRFEETLKERESSRAEQRLVSIGRLTPDREDLRAVRNGGEGSLNP